jgi:hypothetical protein
MRGLGAGWVPNSQNAIALEKSELYKSPFKHWKWPTLELNYQMDWNTLEESTNQ